MGELSTNSGSNYGEYLELDQLAADESPIKNYEVNDSLSMVIFLNISSPW